MVRERGFRLQDIDFVIIMKRAGALKNSRNAHTRTFQNKHRNRIEIKSIIMAFKPIKKCIKNHVLNENTVFS